MQRFICALLFCSLLGTACVSDQENQTANIPEVEAKTVKAELPPKVEPTPAITEVPATVVNTPPTTPPPVKTVNVTTPPPVVTTTQTPPPVQVNTQKQVTQTPVTTTKTREFQPAPKPIAPRPAGAAVVKLINPTHDYGYIAQGDVIKKVFTIKNVGNAPLNILNTTASCGCTRPEYSFMPIMPGETSDVKVTFNSTGKLGRVQSKVTVLTDALPAEYELYLTGTVTDKKSTQKPADKPVAQKDAKKDEKPKPGSDKEQDNKKANTPDDKKTDDKEVEQEEEKKYKSRPILPGRKLPKGNVEEDTEEGDEGGETETETDSGS